METIDWNLVEGKNKCDAANGDDFMINTYEDIVNRTTALLWSVRATVIALVITITVAACAEGRVSETAGAGAGIGAGIGLLVGALRGRPAEGLLVGAAVGAGEGAYEGWRQEQNDARTRDIANAIRDAKSENRGAGGDKSSRAREELTRFLGVWSVEGWSMDGEQRYDVRAKANGNVQMSNFVELAFMDITVNGEAMSVWGEALLGYDNDVGYTYNSRISTLPKAFNANGQFDAANRTFSFTSQGDRMVVRFETPDRFTLETFDGGQMIESYRFTRS